MVLPMAALPGASFLLRGMASSPTFDAAAPNHHAVSDVLLVESQNAAAMKCMPVLFIPTWSLPAPLALKPRKPKSSKLWAALLETLGYLGSKSTSTGGPQIFEPEAASFLSSLADGCRGADEQAPCWLFEPWSKLPIVAVTWQYQQSRSSPQGL